ncbi:DNA primase [Patescibacteria group bacterium]
MSDVDEIKSRLDLVEFINLRTKLKKAGRNFKGLCPFHNEKSPSFVVSPERQMWHCFGCSKGGSIFDFVMEYEHVDFVEALETLAEKAGITLSRRSDATPERKIKDKIYEINERAGEFFQFVLTKHVIGKHARAYVKSRGISDKSVKTFGIGYSPNSWEGLYQYLRKKQYDDSLLEQAGLILGSKKSSRGNTRYYDRFRGRLMFPLKNHRGKVAGFAGRLLDKEAKDLPAGRQEAKYINTSETPVYIKSDMLFGIDVTKRAIQDADEAIIMEGELDVISSFQQGITNVVAIKGSAITEGHVQLLRRFTKKITLALDSDLAGDAAAKRGIDIAEKAGMEIRVATIEGQKDPDDLAREDPLKLKKCIKEAVNIYDYYFSSTLKRFNKETAYGKKNISDELLPIVAKIDNPIVSGHYTKELAKTLGITESNIIEGIKRVQKHNVSKKRGAPTQKISEQTKISREEKIELFILALVLQGETKVLFEELVDSVAIDNFVYKPVREIMNKLDYFLKDCATFLVKDFADSLPSEVIPVFDKAFLYDLSPFSDNDEAYAKEWMKAMRTFRSEKLRRKMRTLSNKIGSMEDPQEIQKLQEELKNITTELAVLAKAPSL